MAIYKPLRLARTLAPFAGSQSMFAMYSEPTGTMLDSVIQSVSIHRGKNQRGGGSNPSTMEIVLKDRYAIALAGHNVRFMIRELPAAALAAHIGVTGPEIERRFTGRLGQTRIEDTGKKYTTTFLASSWVAQLQYAPQKHTPLAGDLVMSTIAALTRSGEPLRGMDVHLYGTSDSIASNQDPVTFRDGITRYAEDLGILLQETRDGRTRIFGHEWRMNDTASRVATELPLTRSQAISPAQWEQANERPASRIEFTITNAAGALATRVAEIDIPVTELRETVEIDWGYIKMVPVEGQLYREAYGQVFASNTRQFTVPSITVDMLLLIGSDKQYHRDQAGQMLRLEAGDPVFFSRDWPTPLQGVHFAEGITETITPTSWTIELSLLPYAQVVGDSAVLTIRPRVWDSAGTSVWDEQTQKWNES